MSNGFQDYEAEVFEINSGRHLTTMFTSTRDEEEPYNIDGELIIGDLTVYQNNSKRLRICRIKRLERISDTDGRPSNKYRLYVAIGEEAVFQKQPAKKSAIWKSFNWKNDWKISSN